MSPKNRRHSAKPLRDNSKEAEDIGALIQSESTLNNIGPSFGVRHKQMILLCLLIFISYCMRVNLSVAIVAMTDPTASSNPDIPTYNWTDKSIVLSAFFWGYILPQIGAGWLGNVFGPKWFLVASMIVGSFCGLLTPFLAHTFGSKGVMAARAVQGFSQGFVYPSVHGLLSKWVPLSERSRFSAFVYAAAPLGTVVSMSVSGLIASSQYGWPMVFYIFGMIGLAWCLIFTYCGYNAPADHDKISKEEKEYIELSSGATSGNKKTSSTPWLKIITSLPVWAILLTQCGYNWSFWTLLTQTPIYMNKIMNFDIKSNSMLSGLPYFVFWICSFPVSFSSDFFINRSFLKIGTSRKIYNTMGFFIPTIALVYLGNCDTNNTIVAVVFLVLAISGSVFLQCGFIINHLDISPNHAGVLMGITNGLSNICGILAPLAVQILVTNETDPTQWQTIFFIAASINLVACAVFICFGSGKVQAWNDYKCEADFKDNLLLARKMSAVI